MALKVLSHVEEDLEYLKFSGSDHRLAASSLEKIEKKNPPRLRRRENSGFRNLKRTKKGCFYEFADDEYICRCKSWGSVAPGLMWLHRLGATRLPSILANMSP